MIDSDSDWLALMAPQLAIAVSVVEEQHVTRAAERLGIPQPTVSAAMHRIAEAIGTPLVQSSGRGIVATAAGRAFLAGGQEALLSLRAARQELQDVIDPDRGRVALGFVHSRGLRDVPALLDAFLAAYPEVSFSLKQGSAGDLTEQMCSGVLDVVIVAPLPTRDDRLESVVLEDERLYLTVGSYHRLAKRQSVELRQVAREPFIALTPGHGLRQIFDQICQEAGFEPALTFEGEDIATLRGLVGVGLGVAVLPKAPHRQKSVVELTISKPASHRLVGAVWLKHRRLPPAARRFVTFLNTSGARVLTDAHRE